MESRMNRHRKKWVRLDNASNIFLAAMSPRDTKVFRISAEVTETVDPELLQEALNRTFDKYLLYHSVLRRGFFWYYLEESGLRPTVQLDNRPTCEALYHFDRKELLFRVVHWKKRISLEVFHILSDGTGAMWFFEDLLKEYILLRHPEIDANEEELPQINRSEDSFIRYFHKNEQRNFTESAQSAIQSLTEAGKVAGKYATAYGKKAKSLLMPVADRDKSGKKVYQVKGTYTPDSRPRIVEMEFPVKEVIQLAKKENISLTIYLTALFIEATRLSAKEFKGTETIAVSVPVNLRQFFPSHSARNFFSVTRLEYTYELEKENSIREISQELKRQFEPQLTKESLEGWLTKLIAFEYNPFARIAIRPIKDLMLKWINHQNNRNLTLAISNLGRVKFNEYVDPFIEQVYFHTVAVRPQFCAISHGEVLTVTFSSPYIETDIEQEFALMLTEKEIPITIAVNKVTQEELGGESK
ncbi:alcohol acetyltransferase [Jeotgalibaca sp. MA1X17-3]|uniref:alcohol acetyltransferase n=1 Tax=Jeotgalibaca sp. MA1X17-3 TaxID=2908211 RepID=UPI001F36383D|nr:alcohol acetyltransferase [Jeotgalibaca sp. MA1X17-3]UJF16355.1 alcohol acetyltransferase [Jeotgalibaca sp. MA1X17-3]